MAARLIAYFPRAAAEAQTVADWDRVVGYASKGISSGTAFDFGFVGDGCVAGGKFCDELRAWSNDLTSMRMDTRVAHMLDSVTQATPWPVPNGNSQPNSPDKRLGDGTYDRSVGFCTPPVYTICPATANAGTDYAFTPVANFRATRGQYHQSNIGQIRYDYVGFSDPNGKGGGFGFSPVILGAENDLLWAEGLIRGSAPDLATAATLINNTRVTRGGLTPATAGDGVPGLLAELQYEQDVELPGDNAAPYYNRRRIDGLQPLTPHQMPIPAKELGVLGLGYYTFGGSAPAFSAGVPGASNSGAMSGTYDVSHLMREASAIWHEIVANQMARIKAVR